MAAESCAHCAVATKRLGMIGVPTRCATHQSRSRFAGQRECGSSKGVLMSWAATPRIYEALRRLSLAAAITPVPDLTGAACAGRSDLFDLRPAHTDDRAYREALALCARCPVLGACRAWFTSLPAEARPYGVIAGRIHRPRGPRSDWSRR